MSAHPLDEAIRLQPDAQQDGTLWHGATHPAYWNMVGPFGGLTAAVLLQAVWGHPERIGTPISLTLTYAAPIVEGPYEVQTECVAATRSTQHWSIRCLQQGKVVVNAIALFAQRRDTWNCAEMRMPEVPAAVDVAPIDTSVARVAWLRRYEVRPVQGGIDVVQKAQAQEQSITRQWVRDEPPRPLDYPGLASICDVFFPRIYLRRGRVIPAGTVSLNLYFHADEATLAQAGTEPVFCAAQGGNFNGGYFDQFAHVWRADGVLLASTQQMVWYKE